MYFTDDPVRDAERYYAALEMEAEKYPVCSICGEHIQQKVAVCYDDKWSCEHCESEFWDELRKNFLIPTLDD